VLDALNQWTLNDSGALRFALETFLQPLLMVLGGAVVANLLVPRWQQGFLRRRSFEERRHRIGEEIAAAFDDYISAWRRLIGFARYMQGQDAPEAEDEAKLFAYAERRNAARDRLVSALTQYRLYGSDAENTLIDSFLGWDEAQGTKVVADLPELAEWRAHQNRILAAIARRFRES
jgi:hypothetical protein